MCRTKITTRLCASPKCANPESHYEEQITYEICIPTHYDHEDYHVDRMEQNTTKIKDAERNSERTGLCSQCEETQRRDPAQYLAWIRNPASRATVENTHPDNVVHFGPVRGTKSPLKLIAITPPLPAAAVPWLCSRLELSNDVSSLATQILNAVERAHVDGDHQDPALLGGAVLMACHLLGEDKKLKAKDVKRCMNGSHRDQIEAAYSLLYQKWDSLLRKEVGGGLRYRMDEARLPKPVRASWAPREHWMM